MPQYRPPANADSRPFQFGGTASRRPPAGGHRGGAWKVAYADFVTALMALFIVLWLMQSSVGVRRSVSGYFRDPLGYTAKLGAGPAQSGEGLLVNARNIDQMRNRIQDALRQAPQLEKFRDHVQFSVTGEGLRIELLETEQGMFFVSGAAAPTSAGEQLLKLLAAEIATLPNLVVIEGHTDSRPYRNGAAEAYGNWELSTDRANAARRLLLLYGVHSNQVVEVRGFADGRLLDPTDPTNPRNRRISLVVRFQDPAGQPG